MANIAQLLAMARNDPFAAAHFASDPSAYLAAHGFEGLSRDDIAVVARVSLDGLGAEAAGALARDLGWVEESAGSFAESLWAGGTNGLNTSVGDTMSDPAAPEPFNEPLAQIDTDELDLAFGSGRQGNSPVADPENPNEPGGLNDATVTEDTVEDITEDSEGSAGAVTPVEAAVAPHWEPLRAEAAEDDVELDDGPELDDFDDL